MEIVHKYIFEFYGSSFLIYQTDQNKLLVPIQHMCEVLGSDFKSQYQRIKKHTVLSEYLFTVRIPVLQEITNKFRDSDLPCVSLDGLPYLLAWIDVKGMKRSARAKIIRFQRQALQRLWAENADEILPDTLITDLDLPSTTEYK